MKRICLLLVLCLPLAAAGKSYGKLPLGFEPNQGQTDARVKFLARMPGYTLFVTSDEAVFAGRDGSVERMELVGANHKIHLDLLDKQPGSSNYFIGNEPSKWRTNIPNYGKVVLHEVYPGIDLVFYGNERQLEYDWVVSPGADPKQIRVEWEGTREISKNTTGDLVLSASLRQKKPVIVQEGKPIEGSYSVRGKQVSFVLARYDTTKPLVIDPVLLYSTYLGGAGGDDNGRAIAVDGSGNVYVGGQATSASFPTLNPLQLAHSGLPDAFVTKFNASGGLVYSTYLGGGGSDQVLGIAVDSGGNAYITGGTSSANFPMVNAAQATYVSITDPFVAKINAAGSALVYSTYWGVGDGPANAIALDSTANAYITGAAGVGFPTVNPMQSTYGGSGDAFVTKFSNAGAVVYSTYLGGSQSEQGFGIAVDTSGNAYVAGTTSSTNFPTTNPIQASNGGVTDTFVTKLDSSGSARVYSTYLGGNGNDFGRSIAVDSAGIAYVTGYTNSSNFPTFSPLQANYAGSNDAFVVKINAAGSAYIYSTYFGGSGQEQSFGIAADNAGNAYIAGSTASFDFPTTNPIQAVNNGVTGNNDAFVTKLNSTGSARLFSTYVGGNADDFVQGMAVDGSGNIYVTGYTFSTNFPTVNPFQAGNSTAGQVDAFVFSISGNTPVGVYRHSTGAIVLTSELNTALSVSGGAFASDPAVAQNVKGDTFVVERDASNALWVNVYDAHTRLWDGWASGGGAVQGMPAIAMLGSVAYIVARDASNAYWTIPYTRGSGFGTWSPRGGNFATDPSTAASSTTVYFTGKDASNSVWTATLTGSTFSAWQFDGAAAAGNPAITVGVDGAAYIAIRDPSSAVWMGRQSGTTFNSWQPGGGTVATDPQVAGSTGKIYAAALTGSGVPWYNTFNEGTGNNWTGWQSPGGVLLDVAASAGSGPQLFLVGRNQDQNQVWWYETPGVGWKLAGVAILTAGPLAAAPR